ncbi:MAG TPA: glycoside hydrolase family 15 protein [Candidatus Binataceae bacterium]|nr:glycoside hydrolase family 15 protein [Candidatus Binataceae bacterium]
MGQAIEDYALIGNLRTAALVGRDGSIDWLCLPAFDSCAAFAALLGGPKNGRWLLAPNAEQCQVTRKYRGESLVLETQFETDDGVASVTDFMPLAARGDRADVIRIVRGIRGAVEMRMELVMRFEYGRITPWVTRREDGISAIAAPHAVIIKTPVAMRGDDFKTVADFTVHQGQTIPFTMTWYEAHADRPEPPDAEQALHSTESWWHSWSANYKGHSKWRDAIMRSLITLKALSYRLTGAIVAAPTTSLPEVIGGSRNWDYRFCWPRDGTFTLYALVNSGYRAEARAWFDWLLRSVAGHPAEVQTIYGLTGERLLIESELPWLSGYEGSLPVRIGNDAFRQFQLDIFGEIMDSLHMVRKSGLASRTEAWALQKALIKFIESAWKKADSGIWEIRGRERHYTHSKVMAWVAVDRAIKAVEKFNLDGPVGRWRELRDAIHKDICANGYNSARKAFTQYYGSDAIDASALLFALVGFLPATDPRIKTTVQVIQRELMRDGFVKRFVESDASSKSEGVFLPCTCWLADNLMLMGRQQEALELFERVLALRNDVGLLSEEYDPERKRLVGNFPQAFSHVSLINTAHNLSLGESPAANRGN